MKAPLRIVVLERPGRGGPAGELMKRVLAMRDAGYRRRHAAPNVAEDPYDALSTHALICRDDADGLVPLMGFRGTPASACEEAGLPFPLASILARGGTPEHAGALADEMEACRRDGREVSFIGLWTRCAGLNADRRLLHAVWQLNGAMMVGMVRDGGLGRILAVPLPSQGTEQFLERYGMVPMEGPAGVLPRIPLPHLPGETGRVMRLDALSDVARADAVRGWAEWERRIVIAPEGGTLPRGRAPSLRIVLLENPSPDDPLFQRVAAMREAGYRHFHPGAVLHDDPYDAISTHAVVCAEGAEGLSPLMCFRSTQLRACEDAGLPFPLVPTLELEKWPDHAAALARELEAHRGAASYIGMWATAPELRRDRPLLHRVMAMTGALLTGLVRDEGAGHVIAAALPSLGTDRLMASYGIREMTMNGVPLPPLPVPYLEGKLAVMVRLEELSAKALDEARAARAEWDRRLVIRPPGRISAAA